MIVIPVILSYNHPELTMKAVRSVIEKSEYQCHSTLLPLILVHNGSEPKNIELLKKTFPFIDHVVLINNKGFSGGSNVGIHYAFEKHAHMSPWVLFLTNDCELERWPILSTQQAPALLTPWIWARKTDRLDSIGGKINLSTGVPSHLKQLESFEELLSQPQKNERPYVPGSAFLIHRDFFDQLKGFDETLETYWEDIDLSLRATLAGLTLGVLPTFQVRHKIGKTCHKHSHYTTYLYQRNRHWVSRKYVKGIGARLQLEVYLWFSWIKLSSRLLRNQRFSDIAKLWKGILEPNPSLHTLSTLSKEENLPCQSTSASPS